MPFSSKPRLVLRRQLRPAPTAMATSGDRSSSDDAVPVPVYLWPNGTHRNVTPIRIKGVVKAFSVEARFAEVPMTRCFRYYDGFKWRRYSRHDIAMVVEVSNGPRPERIDTPKPFRLLEIVWVTQSLADMIVSRQ